MISPSSVWGPEMRLFQAYQKRYDFGFVLVSSWRRLNAITATNPGQNHGGYKLYPKISMTADLETISLFIEGKTTDKLPRCSGVYRFFDDAGSLLYVGKSVDIHSRVGQHLRDASQVATSASCRR